MIGARKKVLWIDDEVEYLRSHIMFLETRGYSVTPVFNADDGIQMIFQKPDAFDIVLLDEQMPGKDGLTALVEIKDLVPDMPIVMVTKSEEESLMEQALGKKIDGYLTKPVNPSQILLICKRLLHSKEIVSVQLKQEYIRNYSANHDALQDRLNAQQWEQLYRNLVKWDIELEHLKDEGIRQTHIGQRSDANSLFADFIVANYMRWMQKEGKPPLMTPQVIDTYVVPRLIAGEKICLVVLDSMRLDQYTVIQPLLKRFYQIENHNYYSILPSATKFSRNVLLSGLYPDALAKQYPEQWSALKQNKSINSKVLLRDRLAAGGFDADHNLEFLTLTDETDASGVIDHFQQYFSKQMVTLIVDFMDNFIHEQTSSGILQDIAPDDIAFRKVTYSWFERSNIFKCLKMVAQMNYTVIFTTSNGNVLCTRGTELYGEVSSMMGLRYQSGQNITCDERYAFFMHEPARFNLPVDSLETSYIVLKENFYFINHDVYQNYNKQYKNTFQHGGISMEEMILPLAIMKPRGMIMNL